MATYFDNPAIYVLKLAVSDNPLTKLMQFTFNFISHNFQKCMY